MSLLLTSSEVLSKLGSGQHTRAGTPLGVTLRRLLKLWVLVSASVKGIADPPLWVSEFNNSSVPLMCVHRRLDPPER